MILRSCLAAALLALAVPASAGEFARSFAAGSGGRLVIALDFGQVDVERHDGDQIHIEATSRGVGASSVHFGARADGNDVYLEGGAEPWVRFLRTAPGVRVRARVPEGTRVELTGASGDEIEGALVLPGPIR